MTIARTLPIVCIGLGRTARVGKANIMMFDTRRQRSTTLTARQVIPVRGPVV